MRGFDEIAGMNQAKMAETGLAQGPRNPTMKENLTRRKEALENQLKDVNAALEMLSKNPDLEEFINVIGRV